MVRSCVASFSDEAALPAVVGERVDVRKGPSAKEPLVVKVYASENRFRHETENAARLWKSAGADLKAHLGVPYFGGRVAASAIKEFFNFNGKVRKNKAALVIHSGDTAAFRVADCEGALAKVSLEEGAKPLFMTVSPRYETDLRTLLGKKGKADKVAVLRDAFDAVAKLNQEAVWSDAFVDNVMFHDGKAMLIDVDYLRDPERLFFTPAPKKGGAKAAASEEAPKDSPPKEAPKAPMGDKPHAAPRTPRFGPAELVVPEALAFTLAFERTFTSPPVPEEAIAPAYHPKGLQGLAKRIDGQAYAHPEGKTRGEWMRDAMLLEQATVFGSSAPAAETVAVVDALASAFPKAGAKLSALRLRYDPYRLAMSILALDLEGGVAWEPRDARFATALLKGLVRVDAALRLSAAEAVAWLDAYIKARPDAIKVAKKVTIVEIEPLPRPPKTIKSIPS